MGILLNELGIPTYLEKIKKQVINDDFQIIPRSVNKNFMRKYRLTLRQIKEIIATLKSSNFKRVVQDNDYSLYGSEPLVVFIKKVQLVDIYGNDKDVLMAIKIKMLDDQLPVISFDESI